MNSNESETEARMAGFLYEQQRAHATGTLSKERFDLLNQEVPQWNDEPRVGVRSNAIRSLWLSAGWDGDEHIHTSGIDSAMALAMDVGLLQYAAVVSFLLQESGLWSGMEKVGRNHDYIVEAFKVGLEPSDLVNRPVSSSAM
jgi:hypothetical protein